MTNRSRPPAEVHRFRVEEAPDDRLDVYLADRLRLSRNRIAELIAEGRVSVNGSPGRKSRRLRKGDEVEVVVPAVLPASVAPEKIPVNLVYEDDQLVVVDKPAGMVVHPAAGHRGGTLVNALLSRLGGLSSVGAPDRPGIVHRLDKDTSGLLVVARTDEAHGRLARAISRREVRRSYLAACWGHAPQDEFSVDDPIGRDPKHRQRMAVVRDGREALTHFRVLERWRAADLLAVRLHTGRTHQIRVHLRSIGHPVVGDPIYGANWEKGLLGAGGRWAAELNRRAGRLFLHATRLSFVHPSTGEELTFTSPLPDRLHDAVEWARQTAATDSPT
ncbi:MAG: RluA family pseudouridine synthase [marine benthic group bacterium]|nr:RluA family pseudouridine synthase [Candidatus Benthicola marisminoris]